MIYYKIETKKKKFISALEANHYSSKGEEIMNYQPLQFEVIPLAVANAVGTSTATRPIPDDQQMPVIN